MSVMCLSKTAARTYRLPGWSELKSLFGEWWHRVSSRYELESLSERNLVDNDSYRCVQRDPEAVLAEVKAIALCDPAAPWVVATSVFRYSP
jgi:hypothetical protein